MAFTFRRRDVLGASLAAYGLRAFPGLAATGKPGDPVAPVDLGPVPAWYDREPQRIGWNILRDVDGGKSGAELIDGAVAAGVTLLCMTVGGSRAFYPTRLPFHERSSALPPGRDLVGEVAAAARARGVRLIARFDFSKQPASTARAHPEWFYTNADGSLSQSQGRFRPCLSAGFYRTQVPLIVGEVIERYRPAMIFLNNFSNYILQPGDSPACHCAACKAAWESSRPGRPLPDTLGGENMAFLREQAQATAALIELPIRRKHPDIVILNSDYAPTDGMHLESRMTRPGQQMWPYAMTEAVDRQLNSQPGKLALGLTISYSHNKARLTVMPPAETRLQLAQAMASGSHPAYAMTGTYNQPDDTALAAAREMFAWHKANADLFIGQRNPARVLMLCQPEFIFRHRSPDADASERGLYQILAENHVPVAAAETSAPLLQRPGDFDLVIVSRGAPLDGIERFVRGGGAAIFVDQHPGFAVPQPVGTLKPEGTAYWRIRDRAKLPGFPPVAFIQAGGSPADPTKPTLQLYPAEPGAALTLVPPMFEDPAEQAASNLKDTDTPGLIWREVGQGRLAFVPWNLGALYTNIYMPAHARLLMALVDGLQPKGREIETDAAASVQMVLMDQPARRRRLLHLINLSGQTQKGYGDPVRTGPIRVALRGSHAAVASRALGRTLPSEQANGRTVVTLPGLDLFDTLVFT